jgi:hypothetical protein
MASAPLTVQCLPACLLESLADDGFAAGLDDPGAGEQPALAEPVVAHAGGVVLEVAEGGVQLVLLDAGEGERAGGGRDAVDVAVAGVFQPGGEPFVFVVQQHELQQAGEVVDVLAGVVEVHDLGGPGELAGGDAPDPGCAVAEDGELPDVVRAAADALGLDQAGERAGGLEGGDDAGGVPVADRAAVVAGPVLGEEDGELDLAGAGAPVFAFPLPAGVSFEVMGTPVPSMTAYSLSGAGEGGSGTSFRAAMSRARSRPAAARAAPLASAARSTRLAVSRTPARSPSRLAAPANGPATAARSFIAARPGDIDVPATPSSARAGRGRACRPRSDTRRA